SSGADRLVFSGKDLGGVFTIRGAEGEYFHWFKGFGGKYGGLLLSSANSLGEQLSAMLSQTAPDARKISQRISRIINETFDLVRGMPDGNSFANSNKALDHFFAYGACAGEIPGPRLHAGS